MGALMANNNGRLLGLYDKLSSFLTQINLYGSKGISDSHDTSTFLMLYNGQCHPWTRRTGMFCVNNYTCSTVISRIILCGGNTLV